MNRKLYWIIRKYWRKCDFYIKRLIYTIRERLELHHNLAQVQVKIVKTMILQICSSLLLAFLLAKCDGFAMDRFSLKPLLPDIVKDITIGGMGIAGVILGLYCANIASIFSAKYSNVPQNLARLFQQDIVTNSCIKQIVGYIVFCTIILLECAVDLNLYLTTMIGLLFLTIRVVVTFSLAGNRSYVLSDTFSIADIKFRDLYNTVKKVSKHDLFTTDQSFQNHYRKVAANDISILREIGYYNMSIPRNQNRTMLLFIEKILALVELYWENKSKISFDSLWFDKKAQYQQWHLASDSEIRIALNTGTSIQPKERKHTYWFEEELYRIDHKRLIVFDLHDLGYSRQFFNRILKRINKRDITKVSDFTFNKNLEFDFTKYAESADYQLLKETKGIHWYGRNSSNQYMDSFYLVWREAKFRCLRKRILDYLLDKINEALIPYHGLAGFSGKVIANCKNVDYSQDFEKLQNGEISVSQFSDRLYLNPEIVEKTED